MDSENSSTAISSKDNISKLAPSKRALFLATYRRNQEWSLPDSVIYYMVKNSSSSKCYQKLIQACKYFFVKNPILIVSRLNLDLYYNDEELVKISHFKALDKLELIDASESFNLNDFFFYIKNKRTTIRLHFYDGQISAAYKKRLQEIVNEIVRTKKHDYKVPSICFSDMD